MEAKLYVGNLPFETSEEDLRELFARDGRSVEDVAIVKDRDGGRSRGFGFVLMGNEEDARSAVAALDGLEISGRNLRVSPAQSKRHGGRA